jgi:hypothetical protein
VFFGLLTACAPWSLTPAGAGVTGMTITSDIVTPWSASATLHDEVVTMPPQAMPWSLVEPSRRHRDHERQDRVVVDVLGGLVTPSSPA